MYVCILVRSDGGPKKWQSTDAGMQSHVLKAASAFLGCLSNELLRLPPIKVYLVFVCIAYMLLPNLDLPSCFRRVIFLLAGVVVVEF